MRGNVTSHWALRWWPSLLLWPGQTRLTRLCSLSKLRPGCSSPRFVISMLCMFSGRTDVCLLFFCLMMMAGSQWSRSNFTFSQLLWLRNFVCPDLRPSLHLTGKLCVAEEHVMRWRSRRPGWWHTYLWWCGTSSCRALKYWCCKSIAVCEHLAYRTVSFHMFLFRRGMC